MTDINPLTLSPEALPALIDRLTPRQREMIALLAQGMSDAETSTILSIKVDTLRKQIKRARLRTGVKNRVQLIVIFAAWTYANL